MSEPSVPPPPPPPYYTPPPAGPGAGGVSQNRSIMLVLSYLGILALIPLLVEKTDPEVQWHAKNGLCLTVADVVLLFAYWLVHFVVYAAFAPLGCLMTILGIFLPLGLLVVHVICIVKALNGQRFIIPGVSQFADRF